MIENTISIDEGMEIGQELSVSENNLQPHSSENICEAENMEETGETQPEETMELTVYGEKVKVTAKEAVAAAQKGLAFDRIKEQLAHSKNDARLRMLESIAEAKGTDTWTLMYEMQHKSVTDDIISRYGSIEAAPFEEVVKGVNTIALAQQNLADYRQTAEKYGWQEQLAQFYENNPGVREIPQEVIAMAKKGHNLDTAYHIFTSGQVKKRLENKERELEMLKAENKSAKSSMPSAANTAAADKKEDEFYKLMKSTW